MNDDGAFLPGLRQRCRVHRVTMALEDTFGSDSHRQKVVLDVTLSGVLSPEAITDLIVLWRSQLQSVVESGIEDDDDSELDTGDASYG